MPRGNPQKSSEDDEYDPTTNISDAEDFEKFSKGVRKISDPRQLKRWGVDDDQYLLIYVAEYAKSKGFRIPWEQVGAQFEPVKTEAAIKQHIDKAKVSRIEAQLPVPVINEIAAPALAPGRDLSTPSLASNKRKDRHIAPAIKARGHKSLLPPLEPIKSGRISSNNSRNQTGKVTKTTRRKKTVIKKEEVEDGNDDCLIVEHPSRAIMRRQPEPYRMTQQYQQFEPFRLKDEQLQTVQRHRPLPLQSSQRAHDETRQSSQMSQDHYLPPAPAGTMTVDVGDGTSAVLENANQLSSEFKAWFVLPVEQKKQSPWFRMFRLDGSPRWDETSRSYFGSKEWHLWKQRRHDSFLHVTVANMPLDTDFLGGQHEFSVNENFLKASTLAQQQQARIQEIADRHGLPVDHESIQLGAKRAGLSYNPDNEQDIFPMSQEQYGRMYSQGWTQPTPIAQMANRFSSSNLNTRAELGRSDSTYFSDMDSAAAGPSNNMQLKKVTITPSISSQMTSAAPAFQRSDSGSSCGTQPGSHVPGAGYVEDDSASLPFLDTTYNSLNSSELSSSVEPSLSATNALDGPVLSQDTDFGGFVGFSAVKHTHYAMDETFRNNGSVAFTHQSPTLEAFDEIEGHNHLYNMRSLQLGSSTHGFLDDIPSDDIDTLGKATVNE